MGFRDENEALRQRIQTLESEAEELREQKTQLEDRLAGRSKEPAEAETTEIVTGTLPPSSLAAHVRERKMRELEAKRKVAHAKAQKRKRAIARLKRRAPRVRVAADGARKVIRFKGSALRDALIPQIPWGFGFAFINPGLFIMLGLGFLFRMGLDVPAKWVFPLVVLTWMACLFAINATYARLKNPAWRLELTDEHFALFKGRGKKPKLFGSLQELEVQAPDPDPAKLHSVRISDGRGDADVDYLVADDVIAMKKALGKVMD